MTSSSTSTTPADTTAIVSGVDGVAADPVCSGAIAAKEHNFDFKIIRPLILCNNVYYYFKLYNKLNTY